MRTITIVLPNGETDTTDVRSQEEFSIILAGYGARCLVNQATQRSVFGFAQLDDGATYSYKLKIGEPPLPQKNIFSDGLPELGPLSDTTKCKSNSSIPTDEQHLPASLKITEFAALDELGELRPSIDSIWNRVSLSESGHLSGYSNEAGVNKFVERVIMDIIYAIGAGEKVKLREEIEVNKNRPDFTVILVNGHPVGTIEGKQPGKDAMDHPNILGEVYDQLLHLRSIFRVDNPFAILTSYESWRICWLNKSESNLRATLRKLQQTTPYATPAKLNRKHKQKSDDMYFEDENERHVESHDMDVEDENASPPPPQPPSRSIGVQQLQTPDDSRSVVDDQDLGADDETREFCGSSVLSWNDKDLPRLLASAIKKMMLAEQEGTPVVLRLANANTSAWKKAPPQSSLDFRLYISGAVKNFFLWEDLGHGAEGRAFLVSGGTKGVVGVLKFFFNDPDGKAKHEEQIWKSVYRHLPPVKTVRVVRVMGQTALLMPWFHSPEWTGSTLAAAEQTLSKDFRDKGSRHRGVAWQNVGVCCGHNGGTKAVALDMQRARSVKNQQEDWASAAVESLAEKLTDEGEQGMSCASPFLMQSFKSGNCVNLM